MHRKAALDPNNGAVLAQERLSQEAITVGMIAAAGMIFVLADDGYVSALR